jgi:hypothetical protein
MFAFGAPVQYRLRVCADEEVQIITANAAGSAFTVSTYWRLHFWLSPSAREATYMGAFDVPGCGTSSVSDAVVAVAWHPRNLRVVISTTQRRMCFATLQPCTELQTSNRALGTSAVVSSLQQTRLEHGIVLNMRSTSEHVIAATSNGNLLVVAWDTGKILRLIASSSLGGQNLAHAPIVDFDSDGRSLCTLLSDGSLCGCSLSAPDLHGAVTRTDGASIVAYSAEQGIVATVASSFATLTFHRYDAGSSTFRDRRVVGAAAAAAWAEDPVSKHVGRMSWSTRGLLCVAVDHVGVALVHDSGAVVFTSFSRYSASSRAPSRQLLVGGVRAFSFTCGGMALAVAEPHSATFEVVPLAQLSLAPNAPVPVAVEERSVSSFRWLVESGHVLNAADGWECITPPKAYLEVNAPLRYASVSPDGQHMAVVGKHGFALHARRLHRWRIFGSSAQEQRLACLCEPAWLGSVAIAIATETKVTTFLSSAVNSEFAVEVYHRHHLDIASQLCRIALPHRPVSVRCAQHDAHMWTLVVSMRGHQLLVATLELHVDSVHNPKTVAGHILTMKTIGIEPPSCVLLDAVPVPGSKTDPSSPVLALHVREPHEGTRLRIVAIERDKAVVKASFASFNFWLVQVAPATFPRSTCIVNFSAAGCTAITAGRSGEWRGLLVAGFDIDSLAIGVSAGQLVCAAEGSRHLMLRLFPFYQIRCTPVNIAYVAFLRAFSATSSAEWSPKQIESANLMLRADGGFASTYDLLVHAVVHDDPPPWEPTAAAYDRRATLRRVLGALRAFGEYYDVVVRCVRKGDVAFWRVIFDVVGSPHLFLEECITHNRIREAVYFVRVLLMERPDDTAWSLEQSVVAARRLLAIVIGRHDFDLGYELLRFVALLVSEINLPPIQPVGPRGIGAIETMLRAVWSKGTPGAPASSPATPASSPPGLPGTPGIGKVPSTPGIAKVSQTFVAPPATGGAVRPRHSEGEAASGRLDSPHLAEERVSAMHQVLAQNEMLRDMIDIEAQELLRRGHIIQLCRMFDAFALDVGHFVAKRYHTLAPTVDLGRAWRTLHRQLGLPFASPLDLCDPRVKADASAIRDRFGLVAETVCTTTQEYLAQCPVALETARALERYFLHLGITEFTLLLDVVLLREGAVKAAMRDSPRLGAVAKQLFADDPLLQPYEKLVASVND